MSHGLTSLENMCSFKGHEGEIALLPVVCDIVSSVCTGEVCILDSSRAASEGTAGQKYSRTQ